MDKKNVLCLVYLILTSFVQLYHGMPYDDDVDFTFPDDFSIGTASSSYQVEGAWNVDGKGEGIWDHFLHSQNRSNGDTVSDFYHRYKEDILLLKEMGVNHLRFSLSWSRLLPTGYTNNVSKSAVQFYHNVLDELEKYNITPVVTLYHFDHPQALEEFGGWINEQMIDVFVDYAKFVFEEYGSRVKIFSTINEPYIMCKFAYDSGVFAPGIRNVGINQYICNTNMLKAHALAYHLYDKEYRHKYNGKVGIVEVCHSEYNDDPNDVEAKEIAHAFGCGLILYPVFSAKGNYPEIVIRNVAERSALQGYKESRLISLSDEWIDKIRGSSDYLGLNHYTSRLSKTLPRDQMLNWGDDSGIVSRSDPNWPTSAIPAFTINPEGMGVILRKIRDDYNNPPVYILENGVSLFRDEENANEEKRINYLYSYMKEMLIAIKRDKCNVKMYTTWSFVDSWEFMCGFECLFGFVSIDFNSKNLTRTRKGSSFWYQSVLEKRKLLPSPSMK